MSLVTPIETLVPHRSPMLLIDEVLSRDDKGIWALARLTADCAFMHEGRVSSAVGLEYLAQTAAALFTLLSMEEPATVRQGMLIACPRLDADIPWFRVGESLLLHVRPASRMPAADQSRVLVKFVGDVYVVPNGVPIEGRLPTQLPVAGRGSVRAELSVYL